MNIKAADRSGNDTRVSGTGGEIPQKPMSGAERMRLMRQRDRQVIADMADAIEKLILLVPVRAGRAESLSSPDLDFIEAALAAGRKKLSSGTGPPKSGG